MSIANMSNLEIACRKWQRGLKGNAFDKTVHLLEKYAGLDDAITRNIYAAKLARFFKGNWNTHHGDAVVKVLQAYKPVDNLTDVENVRQLLAALRKEIGIHHIAKEGQP